MYSDTCHLLFYFIILIFSFQIYLPVYYVTQPLTNILCVNINIHILAYDCLQIERNLFTSVLLASDEGNTSLGNSKHICR